MSRARRILEQQINVARLTPTGPRPKIPGVAKAVGALAPGQGTPRNPGSYADAQIKVNKGLAKYRKRLPKLKAEPFLLRSTMKTTKER